MPLLQKHTYPSPGRCIYCGATNMALTDEHIIPFGLGGKLKLKKASCKPCAKITGAFEQKVLRSNLLSVRTRGDVPTRNPKDRPTTLPLQVGKGNNAQVIEVPVPEYPLNVWLPVLPPLQFLHGDKPVDWPNSWSWFAQDDIVRAVKKHGTVSPAEKPFDHESFLRMLAKIAHAKVHANPSISADDLASFEMLLPDYILNGGDAPEGIFGSGPPPWPRSEYLNEIGIALHADSGRLFVTIRLFAPLGGPTYIVVVGKRPGLVTPCQDSKD